MMLPFIVEVSALFKTKYSVYYRDYRVLACLSVFAGIHYSGTGQRERASISFFPYRFDTTGQYECDKAGFCSEEKCRIRHEFSTESICA